MAITVNPTTAVANSVSVKPRVSISVVSPQAGVTYVLPVAAIEYIAIQVSATLDARGLYPFIQDSFAVVDVTTLTFTKNLADAIAVADHAARSFAKSLTEDVPVLDTFDRQVNYVRAFAEMLGVSDATFYDVNKALADSVSTSDTQARAIDKFIPDGVAMNDTADIGDGLLTQVTKGIMNMLFTSDFVTLDQSKGLSSNATVADSGFVVLQGYCDITYFAEDYVGETRTFN